MENILAFRSPENTDFAGDVDYQMGVYAVAACLIPTMKADAESNKDPKIAAAASQLEECLDLLKKALDQIRDETPLPLRKRKGRPRNKFVVQSDFSNVRVEVRVQWFAHRAFVHNVSFRLRRKPKNSQEYVWRKIFSILVSPRNITRCRYLRA